MQTKTAAVIDDRRTLQDHVDTEWYVVATDSFMSGWGEAPGRSIYAVPCRSLEQAKIVLDNMQDRTEMKRPRLVGKDYRPRLRDGDHYSVRGMDDCSRWYIAGGFK
jgi:hypothetical protein